MSRFILIRGWLECDFEQVEKIKNINDEFFLRSGKYLLSDDVVKLYSKGWYYPEQPINWISIISLGLNINYIALNYIRDMISNIALKEMVDGYFRINDDEEQLSLEWIIKNNCLEEKILTN
ncbi:TPA: hypothetical protein JEL63_003894 [Salmonella enterica subsp. enterica serovar Enteritidis]|uniref:hypothetical protein n=1 Tax=Salmonella enterica TaxID=28901 RepID=UPI0002A6CE92|nr:hypothetical protein [Salmonella enterica]ELO75167.1 hypothetical protein SEEERB17_014690 [Salmonella enterica subsp. enterica serovar Enteritidis str. SARB17]HAE4697492.1 hypothetical protein [Salmonella enterica subsp. enterica serovar Enteritidis]HAU6874446.1 hypothetical protein [Salmonella enterica subsp. enterica serovar Enteritidis]